MKLRNFFFPKIKQFFETNIFIELKLNQLDKAEIKFNKKKQK